MPDLKTKAIALLSSTASIDMETAAKQTLYTVPAGSDCIITHVVLRGPSGTLDGCDDVDFGTGADATTWRQTVTNIADMTATTDYMVLDYQENEATIIDGDDATLANRQFGLKVIDGSNAAATATIDVFGYLI